MNVLFLISLIAAIYLLFVITLYIIQEKMIFFPYKEIVGTPNDLDMEFEDINFTAKDGTSLNGWFIPADKAEYTVLFCHGNGGNISHRLDTISLV